MVVRGSLIVPAAARAAGRYTAGVFRSGQNNVATTAEIVVAGGGVVGLTTAVALARQGFAVTVVDGRVSAPAWQREQYDLRVVALTRASQQLLQQLGAWDGIALRRLSPYSAMQVWDGQGSGAIQFSAADIAEPDLGHIVELSAIEAALQSLLQQLQVVVLRGKKVSGAEAGADATQITLDDGQTLHAKLLIAADGAQSGLREQAGIALQEHDYDHHALVAQVHCEHPHQQTAWQRFTEHGPLALLPLADGHQCSIVWSQPPAQTAAALALDDAAFSQALTRAFEGRLGTLTVQTTRLSFPLKMRHAERYLGERLLLLGDAAHTMHPLAGQGLNLSLADVAALQTVLANARLRQLDPGLHAVLRPFERARRADNTLMLAVVGGFRSLFARTEVPAVIGRNLGMSLLNEHTYAKAWLTRRALGLR